MENKKYKISVYLDTLPVNPREEYDNITKMWCGHKRYNLPKEIDIDDTDCTDWVDVCDEIVEAVKSQGDEIVKSKSIYMLDHSGLRVSLEDFNDCWDSGQIGYIFITKNAIKENKIKDKDIDKVIQDEFNDWKAYMEGNIYGYSILRKKVCKCCGNVEYENVDGLGGIIANDMEDIKKVIEEYTDKNILKDIQDLLDNFDDIEIEEY